MSVQEVSLGRSGLRPAQEGGASWMETASTSTHNVARRQTASSPNSLSPFRV